MAKNPDLKLTVTLVDCEGIELESNVAFRFACCDCGLVHDMGIVSEDGNRVGFAIKRQPEATAERRAATQVDMRAEFDEWLFRKQTEYEPDALNKREIEMAWFGYQRGRCAL